jgi:hypothetical protein
LDALLFLLRTLFLLFVQYITHLTGKQFIKWEHSFPEKQFKDWKEQIAAFKKSKPISRLIEGGKA